MKKILIVLCCLSLQSLMYPMQRIGVQYLTYRMQQGNTKVKFYGLITGLCGLGGAGYLYKNQKLDMSHLEDEALENLENNPECFNVREFHRFIMSSDIEKTKDWIKKQGNVNCQTKVGGHTPLMFAAEMQDLSLVKLFLDAKADPNIQNKYGETALHSTIRDVDVYNISNSPTIAVFEALLKAGANPHLKNCRGDNALDVALYIKSLRKEYHHAVLNQIIAKLQNLGVKPSVKKLE